MKAFHLVWTLSAENQLDSIFSYYSERARKGIAGKIIREIILEAQKLCKDPFLGPKEILLEDRERTYRYLICNNYKIICTVEEPSNAIFIADVFDSRQNPEKIKHIR